jgi:nucleoside-diphosphate-sugar epimerase
MNIVVTGGSGFIGTRLINRLLCKNFNISIFDKVMSSIYPNISIVGDVRNFTDLDKLPINTDVLVHLAAEHKDNILPKSLYYDVNVNGAINLCKLAVSKNINVIIFTSSVAVYGLPTSAVDETGIINPFNEYGKTKFLAENIFKSWQEEDPLNRKLVIIRPTVVFGEGNRGNVYNLFKKIAGNRFVMIGAGKNIKSIAYVENIAAFIEHTLSLNNGIHVYNYSDQPSLSMNYLALYVKKCLGRPSKGFIHIPLFLGLFIGWCFDLLNKHLKRNFSISVVRIRKFCSNSIYISSNNLIDFSPPVSLFDGIDRTVKYEFMQKK